MKAGQLLKDASKAFKSSVSNTTYYDTTYRAQDITKCTPCTSKLLWDNLFKTWYLKPLVRAVVILDLVDDCLNALPELWDPQIEGEIDSSDTNLVECTLLNSVSCSMVDIKVSLIETGLSAYSEKNSLYLNDTTISQKAMNKTMRLKLLGRIKDSTKNITLTSFGAILSLVKFIYKKLMHK